MKRKFAHDYRSNFEFNFAKNLEQHKIEYKYESEKLKYIKPCTYTPDFKIGNIYVETKGRFTAADRAKHLLVRQQNPRAIIIFVFMNPNITLSKSSKTTYWQWADKHNFLWTTQDKSIKFIESILKKYRAA